MAGRNAAHNGNSAFVGIFVDWETSANDAASNAASGLAARFLAALNRLGEGGRFRTVSRLDNKACGTPSRSDDHVC
jgi:hypothetical protein